MQHNTCPRPGWLYGGKLGQYHYARRSADMCEIAAVQAGSAIVPELVAKCGSEAEHKMMLEEAEKAEAVTAAKRKRSSASRLRSFDWPAVMRR
ncbi:hypothetical protein [Rhizobium leguminosarum]|uniref:hypothetical protein n=1 Tax=Rhizobium leguminosarum TaxID=384 RepID=UPI001F4859B3|nr:hypothetical protein [Rhizobium leguminosarum]UIK20656.1 hypothetical protein LZK79_29325 [Rhizobium leguminosarum]